MTSCSRHNDPGREISTRQMVFISGINLQIRLGGKRQNIFFPGEEKSKSTALVDWEPPTVTLETGEHLAWTNTQTKPRPDDYRLRKLTFLMNIPAKACFLKQT